MSLQISRILHAGYLFDYQGARVIFDPIFENPFSRNCFAFPEVEFDHSQIQHLGISAIFISHYHDDHLSFESLNLLSRDIPIYLFCIHELMFELLSKLGFRKIIQLKLNEPVKVGNLLITAIKALDEDIDSIFHIQAGSLNVLNVVDSWIDYQTLEMLKSKCNWDLILWPFQTMRELEVISPILDAKNPVEIPIEWKEQLRILNPKIVVPSSCQFIHEKWSWYNYKFFPISYKYFQDEISLLLPNTQILRLDPSVGIELNTKGFKKISPLTWVNLINTETVDYEYLPELKVPSTAEISKNFPALNQDEQLQVFQFCQNKIVDIYNKLDESSEIYFCKKIIWKLIIYNYLGESFEFIYQIQNNTFKILENYKGPFQWLTEVPMTKLYTALTQGESLTSMYMRINDFNYSDEIMKQIQEVDIVEDPLCRCLFSNSFGSYQLEQLKKIT